MTVRLASCKLSLVSRCISFLTHSPLSILFHTDPNLPTDITPTSDVPASPPSFTNYFPPDGSESPLPGAETTTSSAVSPRFLGHGFNENLIPIYCSILAAVVVGLVAYIVFKRSVVSGQGGGGTGMKSYSVAKDMSIIGFRTSVTI